VSLAVVFFGAPLAREYRIWRLSQDSSLILEIATAPPGDSWRSALGDFLSREYPPGIWHHSGASLGGTISHAGPTREVTVSGQTSAQDCLAYLSILTGTTVHVADGKLLGRVVWTKGVIDVLDADLARAILHARGIATLEVAEDGQNALWAVDRSDIRRGAGP
jgi:hypothetical protein